jgi:hypothetical protein
MRGSETSKENPVSYLEEGTIFPPNKRKNANGGDIITMNDIVYRKPTK